MRPEKLRRFLALLIGVLWPFASAVAVILYGTGDPSVNTSPPTGAFANSGWQFEGQFDGFLGTVIAPNYFITAKHIGGSVGDTFTFSGTNYMTTAVFPDPSSDLQIWRVAGSFPSHAAIYSSVAGTEVNPEKAEERRVVFVALTRAQRYCLVALPGDARGRDVAAKCANLGFQVVSGK